MACKCGKPITKSECDLMLMYVKDPRFFIFNISDTEGLRVAYVPKGENPNDIAAERGFFGENGDVEWYNVREHKCLENENL